MYLTDNHRNFLLRWMNYQTKLGLRCMVLLHHKQCPGAMLTFGTSFQHRLCNYVLLFSSRRTYIGLLHRAFAPYTRLYDGCPRSGMCCRRIQSTPDLQSWFLSRLRMPRCCMSRWCSTLCWTCPSLLCIHIGSRNHIPRTSCTLGRLSVLVLPFDIQTMDSQTTDRKFCHGGLQTIDMKHRTLDMI